VDGPLDERNECRAVIGPPRLNRRDEWQIWNGDRMLRWNDEDSRQRQDRIVRMIEHASTAGSGRRVIGSVKLQVLVDNDVRMPVDLRLVHVFGREEGHKPQGAD
jgi:hypothetical protein